MIKRWLVGGLVGGLDERLVGELVVCLKGWLVEELVGWREG